MATLTVQEASSAGIAMSFVAAAGGGDEYDNTGAEVLFVQNADASSKTVTCATQQTVDGLAVDDRDVVVAAGAIQAIGPLPTSAYNDGSNRVQVTYSDVTSVTVCVVKSQQVN